MDQRAQQPGTPTNVDISLWRVLDHTQFMIARSREMELARFGLTPEQTYVLDILSESGGSTTMNQLVDITQRQHHSISTLVDRMSRQGLVARNRNPDDHRQYEVLITDKGRELFRHVTRESITTIFSSLSKEQKRQLMSELRVLLRSAYEVLGKRYTTRSFRARAARGVRQAKASPQSD